MVNSKNLNKDNRTVKLEPTFKVEEDIKEGEVEDVQISQENLDKIEDVCPHFKILKDRYAQYKNPDDYGNPDRIPTPIARRHSLNAFISLLSKADLSKGLKVQPTRLIKTFVYDEATQTKKPFLIVSQLVVGIKGDGDDTPMTSVSVGFYEYPLQFKKDADGEWSPVNNKFKKNWYIPFTKEEADRYARIGDPHTKKYSVENLDGTRSANLTYNQFLNLSDEEQIKISETTIGK